MAKVAPFHSKINTAVYNECSNCVDGNNIETVNKVQGKGTGTLCTRCASFIERVSASQAGSRGQRSVAAPVVCSDPRSILREWGGSLPTSRRAKRTASRQSELRGRESLRTRRRTRSGALRIAPRSCGEGIRGASLRGVRWHPRQSLGSPRFKMTQYPASGFVPRRRSPTPGSPEFFERRRSICRTAIGWLGSLGGASRPDCRLFERGGWRSARRRSRTSRPPHGLSLASEAKSPVSFPHEPSHGTPPGGV